MPSEGMGLYHFIMPRDPVFGFAVVKSIYKRKVGMNSQFNKNITLIERQIVDRFRDDPFFWPNYLELVQNSKK